MTRFDFEVNGKKASGVVIPLPKAPLVLASGKEGFVMCGYLNLEVAEKLGVAAAVVRGVSTVDELLAAKVAGFTQMAGVRGVTLSMSGKEALEKLL
ncbi:MAG: hypothetical protein KCHDKBKB_01531 [Elusimicrobia bacterium]|nr:hypothetical protein [Elusimicrobiota bacterium]